MILGFGLIMGLGYNGINGTVADDPEDEVGPEEEERAGGLTDPAF